MRYRLHIAYEGTHFHGWQRQLQPPSTDPSFAPAPDSILRITPDGKTELRTVQGVIEQAVREVFRIDTPVQGASRTDTGVHARAQTAAFDLPGDRTGPPDERIAQALNSRLPDDVRIEHAERAPDNFNPIGDCIAKGYRYTLLQAHTKPLWDRRLVYHVHHSLDPKAMNDAASRLVGTHDFAAFTAINHGRETTERTIYSCRVIHQASTDGDRFTIEVAGSGFLYNMVRIIAGTLMDVGRNRLSPDNVSEALKSLDRRATGPTLGPQGLSLEWGAYPQPIGTVGNAWEIDA